MTVTTSPTGLKFCPNIKGIVNQNQKRSSRQQHKCQGVQGVDVYRSKYVEVNIFVLVVMMNCSDTYPDRKIIEVPFPKGSLTQTFKITWP